MNNKNLVLIINAGQGYLRDVEPNAKFAKQNNVLFRAITETYIPLLNMFRRLKESDISFRLGLVLSPALCSLLSDPQVLKQYLDHLDKLIELGKSEVQRCKGTEYEKQAEYCLMKIVNTKHDFTDIYEEKLLNAFKQFAKDGYLELIPTAATSAYLPFFADMDEVLNAQIETGLYSQRNYFGEQGEGFWLPYLGWSKNFEKNLRSYGRNYTIVDARAILFSDDCPETGIFSPVRTRNSLVVFGADPDTYSQIDGDEGYSKNEVYRSPIHDIGYDLPQSEIASYFGENDSRIKTGYNYWSNTDDEDDFEPYSREDAEKQVLVDAEDFVDSKIQRLNDAAEQLGEKRATLVCTISAEFLGRKWSEGIDWLENVIRIGVLKQQFQFELCKNLISDQFSLPKIKPYPCAENGLGYGEDLLDNSNSWMIRYVRKASERMVDLTERFPSESSLKESLLNMAAKQVLLAESGEWPMMIHDSEIPDYVAWNFRKKIITFTRVFDALASNTVSTEWLTKLERESAIFPWLNYRVFARKR